MPEFIKTALGKANLAGFLNSKDHTREINLAAFAFGVIAATIWISKWVWSGPRDANLVAALGAFLAAVTGGLFKRGSAPPSPPSGGPDA